MNAWLSSLGFVRAQKGAASLALLLVVACGPGPGRLPEVQTPPEEPIDSGVAPDDPNPGSPTWPSTRPDAGFGNAPDAELPHVPFVDASTGDPSSDAGSSSSPDGGTSTPRTDAGSSTRGDAGATGSPDANVVTPNNALNFPAGLTQALQQTLDNSRANQGSVGAGLGVLALGVGTWVGTSGGGLPGGPALLVNDQFQIGSVTQNFTAALVLKLVEQGAINLDQPIATWYPSLPGAQLITVRMLLNHTSGLADYFDNPNLNTGRTATHESLLAWPAQQGLRFQPGSQHVLSNTNYILLGLILEQVTGASYRAQLRVRLLTPLGLGHTFLNGEENIPNGFAPGFAFDGQSYRLAPATHPSLTWASGGLVSSMEDLLHWFEALANGRVLGQTSLDAMTTGVPIANTSGYYGLGLMGVQTPRGIFFFMDGALDGSNAVIGYLYDHQVLITAWTNTQNANPYVIAGNAALTMFP